MKMKKEIMCLLSRYVPDICYVIQICFGGFQMLFIHVSYEFSNPRKMLLQKSERLLQPGYICTLQK